MSCGDTHAALHTNAAAVATREEFLGCINTCMINRFTLQLKIPLKNPNLLPADISLFEVWSHADRLSVELIGLLKPRLVGSDQIGQVYVNIEVVRGHTCRVLLPGDDLARGQNEFAPHQRGVENRLSFEALKNKHFSRAMLKL